jgi:uncharacterized protein YqjF (DUF2071 family)
MIAPTDPRSAPADTRFAFLTAEWRDLAILNFETEPTVLRPFVPAGTELDEWRGRTLVSLVGFRFRDTRVFGVPIPWHRNFDEVNLRFYVRRHTDEGWRRGVVFIKELVPRVAIALTARLVYGERYVAVPMGHRVEVDHADGVAVRRVSYRWRFQGRDHQIGVTALGAAEEIAAGSEAEFIAEHYWGYTRGRRGGTLEYRVDHPRWRAWTAQEARFDGDVARVYGDRFVETLNRPPVSAFLAEGSAVTVFTGTRLASPENG